MATAVIIGRPNVGKSTLFNRLSGGRRVIVDNQPGVTRDFVHGTVEWQQKHFNIVDTCGLFESPENIMEDQMRNVTIEALQAADLILFVVDARAGVTPADLAAADRIRKSKRPVLLVANKVEQLHLFESLMAPELYSLGFGEPIPLSSEHGLNIDVLLDGIISRLEETGHNLDIPEETDLETIRVAVTGRPNVGKSSLFNAILGSKRSLVTELPGTTRDSIDETILLDRKPFTFIDTAGMRRKTKVGIKNVEYYSVMRSVDAIERCTIVVLVIDAREGIGAQDKRIAGLAEKNGKGTVVVFNKSDLVTAAQIKLLERTVRDELYFIDYSPVIFTAATISKGIDKLIDSILLVTRNLDLRIPTSTINELLERYTAFTPAPGKGGRKARAYYANQVSNRPPLFMLHVNDPKLFSEAFLNGFRRAIRKNIDPMDGAPIFLKLRRKR